MPKIILNKRAEAELMTLGFHKIRFNNQMSELDRIRQNLELVEQINHFTSKGGHIKPAPKNREGAYYDPENKSIHFEQSFRYSTARIMSHEVGHALGKHQAKSASYYNTAKAYAQARGYGEAEAIFNEARMVA